MSIELPDARSFSPETLELFRRLAVRSVLDLGRSNKETAQLLGLADNTISQWVSAYRKEGEAFFQPQDQGRPPGSGRSLTAEQEQALQTLLRDVTPEDHGIPLATWTPQAVAELIEKSYHVPLTLQGVGKYLARWNFTPQNPSRQAREQDSEEVREFLQETLPDTKERAEQE